MRLKDFGAANLLPSIAPFSAAGRIVDTVSGFCTGNKDLPEEPALFKAIEDAHWRSPVWIAIGLIALFNLALGIYVVWKIG